MEFYRPMTDPGIIDELRSQTDRGVAIIGGSIVEGHLRNAVMSRLHPLSNTQRERLFTGFGPLSSFSAKIEVAFAMGVFGEKSRADLMKVKEIRNDFAHNVEGGPWSFGHPEITKICAELYLVEHFPHIWGVPPKKDFKERFIRTVFILSIQLDGESIANRPTLIGPKFLTM
jgi:hypothetical protein